MSKVLLSSKDSSLYIDLQTIQEVYTKPPMEWFSFMLHMVMENQVLQGDFDICFCFLICVFKKCFGKPVKLLH